MCGEAAIRLACGALLSIVVCPQPASAQLPQWLQRCLPYPTLAQEIDDMRAEVASKESAPPPKRVIVDDVNFDGVTRMPQTTLVRLAAQIEQSYFDVDFEPPDQDTEAILREAWWDLGYNKMEDTATTRILKDDSSAQHVALTIHVDEGPQYRLQGIHFREAEGDKPLAYPPRTLRKLIPLTDGDLVSVKSIREGIEALNKLYGPSGYIDFVATPQMDFQDEARTLELTFVLDEGNQFRVGNVEISGLDPKLEAALRSELKPGNVFNYDVITRFYRANKQVLHPSASPADVSMIRNQKTGIVNIRVDSPDCQPLRD